MWGQFLPSSDSSSDNSDGVSVDSDASTVLLLPEIIITPPSPTDSEWEAMLREDVTGWPSQGPYWDENETFSYSCVSPFRTRFTEYDWELEHVVERVSICYNSRSLAIINPFCFALSCFLSISCQTDDPVNFTAVPGINVINFCSSFVTDMLFPTYCCRLTYLSVASMNYVLSNCVHDCSTNSKRDVFLISLRKEVPSLVMQCYSKFIASWHLELKEKCLREYLARECFPTIIMPYFMYDVNLVQADIQFFDARRFLCNHPPEYHL